MSGDLRGEGRMNRDFVFALRQLRTNFKFSVIVVLTLALGIGSTTAIFSVVSGVLLKALPFPEPDRIVSLQTIEHSQPEADSKDAGAQAANSGQAYPSSGEQGWSVSDVSFPDFFDWRQQSKTLEAVASHSYGTSRKFTPAGNGPSRIIAADYVSADFFCVLGVTPMLGRD